MKKSRQLKDEVNYTDKMKCYSTDIIVNGTRHGFERMDERLNIKSVYKKGRQIQLAFERGLGRVDADKAPKKLIKYIIEHEEKNPDDVIVRIYGGMAYIFSNVGLLITVFGLPKTMRKIYENTMRKINRRSAQYIAA